MSDGQKIRSVSIQLSSKRRTLALLKMMRKIAKQNPQSRNAIDDFCVEFIRRQGTEKMKGTIIDVIA